MPATESLIRCAACGAQNRVPLEKIQRGLAPVCGRCKARLVLDEQPIGPIAVTDATYASVVEQSPIPVLLDLWAPWCGPCRMLAPIIDELAKQFANRIRFAKLNTDENQSTAARFRISGIPTLILFQHGQEVDRIVGVAPKAELARRLVELAAGRL